MKKTVVAALLGAAFIAGPAASVSAGPIESACLRSDRKPANRSLCGCIQQAADMTLGSGDQRRAAKFFSDPDLAHTVWVSKRAADDAFWERYKQFGSLAEVYCGG